ncbi:MAG: hypothetical protein WBM58_08840 [Sedimenticolaceae bacterium]
MTKRALVALFLLPGLAHAVICKTVDSEGVVAYAEVPAAHRSKCPNTRATRHGPSSSRVQPGHCDRVFLDNVPIPGGFDGLAIEFTGVDVCGHKLRVTVMEDGGTRLIDSAAVTFILREADQID